MKALIDVSYGVDDLLKNEVAARATKELKKVYSTMLESRVLKTLGPSRAPIARLIGMASDYADEHKQDLLAQLGDPVLAHFVAMGFIIDDGGSYSIAPEKPEPKKKKTKKDEASGSDADDKTKKKKDKKDKKEKEKEKVQKKK